MWLSRVSRDADIITFILSFENMNGLYMQKKCKFWGNEYFLFSTHINMSLFFVSTGIIIYLHRVLTLICAYYAIIQCYFVKWSLFSELFVSHSNSRRPDGCLHISHRTGMSGHIVESVCEMSYWFSWCLYVQGLQCLSVSSTDEHQQKWREFGEGLKCDESLTGARHDGWRQ